MLVTAAEKDRINRQAAALGVSASEFVRKAASLIDANDLMALEEVRGLLPEFNAALSRIHHNLVDAVSDVLEHEGQIADMRSSAYRERVREDLAADPDLLAAGARLFGVEKSDSEEDRPSRRRNRRIADEDGPPRTESESRDGPARTMYGRLTNIARTAARAHVEEPREEWRPPPSEPRKSRP